MNKKKLIGLLVVIALVLTAIIVLKETPIGNYFTLQYIKAKQQDFLALYHQHSFTFITIFAAIYIITTALSLPIAAILTLLAGAIFGFVAGTIIVSFASTIGATCAFIISRWLLRDTIKEKYGHKLSIINDGIKREGPFYLFALRLVPIFPFFLINIVMALTPMKTFTFYWVSQIGMLLGTMAYVNAGLQLSQISSLKGILSFNILIAFAILGILPLISKRIINFFRTTRPLTKYKKPKTFDYNLVVIGAGSGGLVASYMAATLKAKVALIEKNKMGGDCLNTGCVPSKSLIRVTKLIRDIKDSEKFGIETSDPQVHFEKVMAYVHDRIHKVAPHDSVERYTSLGVDCLQGEAIITSPYSISINEKEITTKNIIVATGGSPNIPRIRGLKNISYYTSDTIWTLETLPKKLLIVGGGPVGCELAQCFNSLGSKVTIIQHGSQLLKREDKEISQILEDQFIKDGITIYKNITAESFENIDTNLHHAKGSHKGKPLTIEFDCLLFATGRSPNLEGFGLEDLGVERLTPLGSTTPGIQTNFPNIFICGDASGSYQFTHFAAHQATYASINALFRPLTHFKPSTKIVPWCTFTYPEIARVGLNEKEAKEQDIDYEVTTYNMAELDRAIADSHDFGLVKVLTPPGKDDILGATVVSPHATEIIAEFTLAMKNKLDLGEILQTIHIYPTYSEAAKYTAGAWNKSHTPKKLLRFLEKFHAFRRR